MDLEDKWIAHFTKEPKLLRTDTIEYEIHIVKYYQEEDDSWEYMIFRERSFAENYAHWVRDELGFAPVLIEDGYAPPMVDPVCYKEYRDYLDRLFNKKE